MPQTAVATSMGARRSLPAQATWVPQGASLQGVAPRLHSRGPGKKVFIPGQPLSPPVHTWLIQLPGSGSCVSPRGGSTTAGQPHSPRQFHHSPPRHIHYSPPRQLHHSPPRQLQFVSPRQYQRTPRPPSTGKPLQLQQLPPELLQCCLDLVPSFAGRARVRAVCKAAAQLEWRMAAPGRLDEELSRICLGDLGAGAVAQALAAPTGTSVRELCLGGNGIGDKGACSLATVLAGSRDLRRLSLRDNAIGDEGAASLAAALAVNSSLEELDIWGNRITSAGKRALLKVAKCKVFLELDPVRTAMVSGSTRAVLFDWISQVHNSSTAPAALNGDTDPQEVLFRTFRHVDSYLTLRRVARAELQLLGVACTLVAAAGGAEDSDENAELSSWLALVTDGACTEEAVRSKAREVHKVLAFRMHQPTAYTFLRRYLRKTGWTEESFSLANYLIELAAMDAEFLLHRPQTIAAAAAVLSRQYISKGVAIQHVPGWKARLRRGMQVDLHKELAPCAAAMARMHSLEHGRRDKGSGKFVNAKYEWARLHLVAKITPNPPQEAALLAGYLLDDSTP